MILKGDGTWPFVVKFAGQLFVDNVVATWFGGNDDPQDKGETACQYPTKGHPELIGCSLPLDMGAREKWTDGSPLPRLPWGLLPDGSRNPLGTFVTVWPYGREELSIKDVPLIDDGPGKQATRDPKDPHAIDLTKAAFSALAVKMGKNPDQALRDGTLRVSYKIFAI